MSHLRALDGPNTGQRFALHTRTRIGRSSDNDIRQTDAQTSRHHAEVVRTGLHFEARDLKSRNGIRVNSQPFDRQVLVAGDRLTIGKTTYVFETVEEYRSSRFSDATIHFDPREDDSVQAYDGGAMATSSDLPISGLIGPLGALMDAEPDEAPEALRSTLDALMDAFGAEGGVIVLRGAGGAAIPLVAGSRNDCRRFRLNQNSVQLVLDDGKALLGAAWCLVGNDDRPMRRHAILTPLPRRDHTFGLVLLQRPRGRAYTHDDLVRLCTLAPLISAAVRHAVQQDQSMFAPPETPSDPYIGASKTAERINEDIRRMGAIDSPVLILGETGTGKELTAQAIHAASARAKGPFVTIDCSAIPANLMESDLFGHEAGAFTGANRMKRGKVEIADGGTLFLDEIGELALDLQPKLLRFLEELVFYRVGGLRPLETDVRVLAATNRDLKKEVAEGRFREDLIYRLNVMPLELPPLRDHTEDLPRLIEHFAPRLSGRVGKPFLGVTDDALALLTRYRWPGNVRELRHGLERALILSDDGVLRPEHFQLDVPDSCLNDLESSSSHRHDTGEVTDTPTRGGGERWPSLAEIEIEAIRRTLRRTNGNQAKAARILRIHRNTLANKLRQYGEMMDDDTDRPHDADAQ